jgi:hypothetical protein
MEVRDRKDEGFARYGVPLRKDNSMIRQECADCPIEKRLD